MKYPEPLIKARLIKRYKRFLADVYLCEGAQQEQQITIHTANTGSMSGCAIPGTSIWISNSHNPKRKYPFTWELSSSEQGQLIGINTHLANVLAKEAIEAGLIRELTDIAEIATEVSYGQQNSRIDLLAKSAGGQCCYIEVKSVTASFEPGVAAFPDAITKRGTKHLHELALMVEQGHRAVLLFCVQRQDCTQFRAAQEIDPVYAETLKEVRQKGVEVLAYGVHFSGVDRPDGLSLSRKLLLI